MESDLIDFRLTVGSLASKPEKLIHILDGAVIEEFVWSAQSVIVKKGRVTPAFLCLKCWQVLRFVMAFYFKMSRECHV